MSNNLKLLLVNNNKKILKKNTNINTSNLPSNELNIIKSNEINKLRNPTKGQIYVHLSNDDDYLFYRFDGNSWLEIK